MIKKEVVLSILAVPLCSHSIVELSIHKSSKKPYNIIIGIEDLPGLGDREMESPAGGRNQHLSQFYRQSRDLQQIALPLN